MLQIYPFYESEDEEVKPKVIPNKTACSISGWKEHLLKEQLTRGIRQCGFEHPSQVQNSAIPYILQGHDLLCQAKSGMGKTGVFVISILNMMTADKSGYNWFQCIVLAHTRQMTHQIAKDFKRIGKYFKNPPLRIGCYFGGVSIQENLKQLSCNQTKPNIIVSTPARLIALMERNMINVKKCKYFVIDQCDKMLQGVMNQDVHYIMDRTPKYKQIMMFSATINDQVKWQCRRIMNRPIQICIDQGQLILHGLTQFYVRMPDQKKYQWLILLLDTLAFNQVIIFVNRVERAKKLTELLFQSLFNPICIHSSLRQQERLQNYDRFKANFSRLLVATDLFGRGIDIERVNLVINFDFPLNRDTYLHRVGRAGRFGTKGLAINFIRSNASEKNEPTDQEVLLDVQKGFKVKINELPKEIDVGFYM